MGIIYNNIFYKPPQNGVADHLYLYGNNGRLDSIVCIVVGAKNGRFVQNPTPKAAKKPSNSEVFFLNGVSLASNAGIWNLLTRAPWTNKLGRWNGVVKMLFVECLGEISQLKVG